MQRNVVLTKWTEVEVDGERYILFMSTKDDAEVRHLISEELRKLDRLRLNIAPCVLLDDGTLGIPYDEELRFKIKAKLNPGHKWTEIQLPTGPDQPA